METQSTPRPISQGTCAFCKAELVKNKMTQHLKFCKQRLTTLAAQERQSQEKKIHIFHILAEGKYNPQYWLHFEVPASEALGSLDRFLKDMWIDDLDHLSVSLLTVPIIVRIIQMTFSFLVKKRKRK